MAYDVSFRYRLIDAFSSKLDAIGRKTQRFKAVGLKTGSLVSSGFGRIGTALDGVGTRLRGIPNLANSAGSALAVMAASIPVSKALEFERAVTDLDKKFDFDSLSERSAFIKGIKALGPELGFSATQMAKLTFEAGKLNIAKNEVADFVGLSAKAAVALDGLPIEESGQIIGDLKAKFTLGVEGVESLLDSVNTLADGTTTNGGAILKVLGRMSSQFDALNFPPHLAAGLSAFARQVTVTDELAASGLKLFTNKLIEMGKQADLQRAPVETILGVVDKLKGIDEGKRGQVIQDMFGLEAAPFVTALTEKTELLAQTMGLVGDKAKFAGSMQKEFDRQNATTSQKLVRLKAKFDLILVTLGEKLLPTIGRLAEAAGPVLERFLKFVDTNPGLVKVAAAVAAVVAALVPLAAIAGTALLIFNPIGLVVTGITVAIGLATAAVIKWWDQFKAFGNWINDIFGGWLDGLFDKFNKGVDLFKRGLAFLGIGGAPDPTISEAPAGTSRDDPNVAKMMNQRATLGGRIGIDVNGPGKVNEASLFSDTGGNLGFNVAHGAAQ